MKHLVPLAGIVLALALTPNGQSQLPNCAGVGNAGLSFELDNNTPFGAGTAGNITLTGDPDTCYWLVCDVSKGAGAISHPLFGTADLCVPLNPGFLNVDACFSPTGVVNFPFKLPYGFTEQIPVCCQFAGIHTRTLELTVSNLVCICANTDKCDSINQLSYSTCFDAPTSFPVKIRSSWDGSGSGAIDVDFDPANPPSFPITKDELSIEKIAVINNQLCVYSRIDVGKDKNGGFNELSSSTEVEVQMGSRRHSETLHTSCSRPISGGMVFGDFQIHEVVDPLACGAQVCEGGVNCLGYCTELDAPHAYPVVVTSRFSEPDGSNAESVSVSFDPNNPPTFPVTSANGQIAIESIEVVGNALRICSFADRGTDANGNRRKFSKNDILFVTKAGLCSNRQVIHLSCSKPIGPGLTFGKYEITRFCSVDDTRCDGGINILGLRTDLDEPASYPAKIVAGFSETSGSGAATAEVMFDPANPPAFPVTNSAGNVIINSIRVVGGKLQVNYFVDNGRDSKGKRRKFEKSTMRFKAYHSGDMNKEDIHVSCSKPIGQGSVFGDFEILRLVSKD